MQLTLTDPVPCIHIISIHRKMKMMFAQSHKGAFGEVAQFYSHHNDPESMKVNYIRQNGSIEESSCGPLLNEFFSP